MPRHILSAGLLLFLALALSAAAFGQESKVAKSKNKQYEKPGYRWEISQWQALPEADKDLALLANDQLQSLAESFFWIRDYAAALPFFAEMNSRGGLRGLSLLHYAQALQSAGECQQAALFFKAYQREADPADKRGQAGASACANPGAFVAKGRYALHNEAGLNSENFEYLPVPYKTGEAYSTSSFRSPSSDNTVTHFSEVRVSASGERGSRYESLSPNLASLAYKGQFFFSEDGKKIFFTGVTPKLDSNLVSLKIYTATHTGFDFDEARALPFCADSANMAYPFWDNEAQRLYFASDQAGGHGGYDLYYCRLDRGQWSAPVNLGPAINTAGDEIEPSVFGGRLYFASNGHAGLGGFDLFRALNQLKGWGSPANLGSPFNSPHDDSAIRFTEAEGRRGYLVSARPGGKGEDDIYSFELLAD